MSNLIKLKQIENGRLMKDTIEANKTAVAGLKTLVGETSVAAQIQAAKPEVHTISSDSTDISVLTAGITPKAGDILIVTSTVNNVKSAYHYDVEDGWIACDGNVDATKVILKEDITLAGDYTQVGNLTKEKTKTATFATAGKSVAAALTEIFSKRLQPKITANPTATIDLNQAKDANKSYEVGTEITPSYSAKLSAGSYTYGPATGITASTYTVTDSDGHSSSSSSGSFPAFIVEDGESYKVSVSITYNAGAVAVDNLGTETGTLDGFPKVQIAGGTKTDDSYTISGYRAWFVGGDSSKTLDSATIRKLTNMGTPTSTTFELKAADYAGCTRIVVAIPSAANKSVTEVYLKSSSNADILGEFKLQKDGEAVKTVEVAGTNNYTTTKPYKVWVYEPASLDSTEVYTITVG